MSLSSIIESLRERKGGLAGSFKRQFIISFLSHYVKTIAFCKRCSFGIIKKFNLQNMVTYVMFLHSASCEVLISKDTSSHKMLVWSMELDLFTLLVNCLSYQKVQLNEYETAPYFIQFSQNLTCDWLLISVFSPEFTWAAQKIVLCWCSKQFFAQLR